MKKMANLVTVVALAIFMSSTALAQEKPLTIPKKNVIAIEPMLSSTLKMIRDKMSRIPINLPRPLPIPKPITPRPIPPPLVPPPISIDEGIAIGNALIKKSVNPEELKIASQDVAGNVLTLRYTISQYLQITVNVNLVTRISSFAESDRDYVNAIMRSREIVSQSLKTDIDGVWTLNLFGYDIRPMQLAGLPFIPPQYGYEISLKTVNYRIGYRYSIPTQMYTLISLVNGKGIDLVAQATSAFYGVFGSGRCNITQWRENGKSFFEFDFELKNGEHVSILVHKDYGEARFADRLIEHAVIGARQEVADKMGIDIGRVCATGCSSMTIRGSSDSASSIYPETRIYIVEAETLYLAFTLRYDCRTKTFSFSSIRTKVTNVANKELIKVATAYLVNTLNPSSYSLADWHADDGENIVFVFDLPNGRIDITVNFMLGAPYLTKMREAVIAARTDIAGRMGVDLTAVHVNGIEALNQIPENPQAYGLTVDINNYRLVLVYQPVDYRIAISAPKGATGSVQEIGPHSNITLRSFINKDTGQDLYANAVKYLQDKLNPGTYKLADWGIREDSNFVQFDFYIGNGTITRVSVHIDTGEPFMPNIPFGERAREYLARELGVEKTEVQVAASVSMRRPGPELRGPTDGPTVNVAILLYQGNEYYVKGITGGLLPPGASYDSWQLSRLETSDPLVGATKAKLELMKEKGLKDEELYFTGCEPYRLQNFDGTIKYKVTFVDDQGNTYEVQSVYNMFTGDWTIRAGRPKEFGEHAREFLAQELKVDENAITLMEVENVTPLIEGVCIHLATLNYNGVEYYVKGRKGVYPGAEWGSLARVYTLDPLIASVKARAWLAGELGADKGAIRIIGSESLNTIDVGDGLTRTIMGVCIRLVTLAYNGQLYYVKTSAAPVIPDTQWGNFQLVEPPKDPNKLPLPADSVPIPLPKGYSEKEGIVLKPAALTLKPVVNAAVKPAVSPVVKAPIVLKSTDLIQRMEAEGIAQARANEPYFSGARISCQITKTSTLLETLIPDSQ